MGKTNRKTRKHGGFSLIELLIVVAIILIIAAIAIPNLMRARMAANESSAVGSLRTINSGEITYQSTFPTVGYASALSNLGGTGSPCIASPTNSCLIDNVLAQNGSPAGSGKSGYTFRTGAGLTAAGVTIGYAVQASPLVPNKSGGRAFCSVQDAVIRVDPAGVCANTQAGILAFGPLNQ